MLEEVERRELVVADERHARHGHRLVFLGLRARAQSRARSAVVGDSGWGLGWDRLGNGGGQSIGNVNERFTFGDWLGRRLFLGLGRFLRLGFLGECARLAENVGCRSGRDFFGFDDDGVLAPGCGFASFAGAPVLSGILGLFLALGFGGEVSVTGRRDAQVADERCGQGLPVRAEIRA